MLTNLSNGRSARDISIINIQGNEYEMTIVSVNRTLSHIPIIIFRAFNVARERAGFSCLATNAYAAVNANSFVKPIKPPAIIMAATFSVGMEISGTVPTIVNTTINKTLFLMASIIRPESPPNMLEKSIIDVSSEDT